MKILISSDSFKGSLSSKEVGEALKAGILNKNQDINVEVVSVADGGEGSLSAINESLQGEEIKQFVKDPFWRTTTASYLKKDKTAYIEMAAASGLHLIKESQRNPEFTTSYGTGQQIKHAVKNGVDEVYLFVGGTATNDGGIGMAQTLGYKFLDEAGESVLTIGEGLSQIKKIVPPEEKLDFKLKIVVDVNNPLYGPNGAAHIFAAQKGADEATIERLDNGLRNLSEIIKRDLGKDVSQLAGGGAAGGVGAGMSAFFDAEILPGTETIMDIIGFDEKLKGVDLIITGEGKLDHQTLSGKLIAGICKKAKSPVIAVCGINELSEKESETLGLKKVYSLVNDKISKSEAIENAKSLLTEIGEQIVLDLA
ncbi:glycerate kinase family protein [Arcticibacterium luteifluviistationis]|uniref:Glycerate kinase n=1 Tax=Arcticibacterium luteifluviistationis TaxID=1784714 RepID=A0A2Z4GGC6_9BACT|nr:glycerate kinase [Arcticibacterium luteifluviistationis]AWW00128.1 glycerate kinase [Arcticibacterium luteifluviistationis]